MCGGGALRGPGGVGGDRKGVSTPGRGDTEACKGRTGSVNKGHPGRAAMDQEGGLMVDGGAQMPS